jgi:glyoxylase-like metal-dependent hydrolase (beta-lactamase superfamily II)
MIVEQRIVGQGQNFTYLLGDPATRKAAVVDPSYDSAPMRGLAEELDLRIELILNTHDHIDHVYDNRKLADATGAKIAAHRLSTVDKDVPLEDGDVLEVGEMDVKVLHTPGHSPDSCCFLVGKLLWTGDTLFVGECGRTDLPGGDPEAMYHSLFDVLLSLEDDVTIYPGHDYGPMAVSTIGHERTTNYTLEPRSLDDFVRFMAEP